MSKKTNHLTLSERERIYTMRGLGKSLREIAKLIGRSHSCISKELKRNKAPKRRVFLNGYAKAHYAHELAKERKSQPKKHQRLKSAEIRAYVTKQLELKRSPRDISLRIKSEKGLSISHEAIYQWIYEERRDLIELLPRKGKRRNRAHKRKRYMKGAAKKVSISKRPAVINDRLRIGDWEGDTIFSRQSKYCLFTLTERVTRFTFIFRLEACNAACVLQALLYVMYQLPPEMLKSLTLDNGSENSCHEDLRIKTALEVVYFCHAYCSWERGTVENANGFIRRHFPKKTDFANVTNQQVAYVQDWMNTRMMDCLGGAMPQQLFMAELAKYPNPLLQRFPHLGDIKQSFLLKAA